MMIPYIPATHKTLPNTNSGVSLLETILALVIVTIGLMGSLKLFSNSIKGTGSADTSAIASELSTQLIERMRSNTSGATNYSSTGLPNCQPVITCIQTSSTTPVSCSPAEMAAFDLQQISCINGITDNLPLGDLAIQCNGTFPAQCTIEISWKGSSDRETRTITNNIVLGRP